MQTQVADVVEAALHRLGHDDPQAFCALLTKALRDKFGADCAATAIDAASMELGLDRANLTLFLGDAEVDARKVKSVDGGWTLGSQAITSYPRQDLIVPIVELQIVRTAGGFRLNKVDGNGPGALDGGSDWAAVEPGSPAPQALRRQRTAPDPVPPNATSGTSQPRTTTMGGRANRARGTSRS